MAGLVGYGVKRHFQQYFRYIVAVSLIGGGNWRKALTWQISSHYVASSTHRLNGMINGRYIVT
jgi:hypothetical protein